jgi:hypothetical protein
MLARRRPESIARNLAVVLGAGRVAIGLGATLATGPALRALGFSESDGAGRALARMAGARDLALGALVAASAADRSALRSASLACAAADAGDALVFGTALVRRDGIDRAAIGGGAAALAATGLHVWIASRS